MRSALRNFSARIIRAWRIGLRHPRKFTFIFFLTILFFGLQLKNLTAELRIYDIADPKFPSTEQLRKMKTEFGDENSVLLLFKNENGTPVTNAEACKIRDWASQVQEGPSYLSEQITSILNPFRLKKPALDGDRVKYNPVLPEFHCDSLPFSTENLIHSPWGGLLTSLNGKDLAVQVSFSDTEGGSRYGKFNPAPIGALWKDLETNLLAKNPELHAYLGGRSSFQWYYQQALKKDTLINLAVLVLLLLFFRLFYGTWKSGLILLGVILITAIVIFGAMAFTGSPVDYLSNGLFLMMCIAAVEDFIFISHEQLAEKEKYWHRSVRSLILPGFFTSLTTAIGFISLETADLQIIRRFGAWAGLAALCEWGIIFFALPYFLKTFRMKQSWVSSERAHFQKWVGKVSGLKLPRILIKTSVILFGLSIFGFFYLNINDSPRGNFLKSHMQRQAYEYLRESRGWEGPIFVIFPNAFTQKENEAALENLRADKNIARIENPYDLNRYFTSGFDEDYQRLVNAEISLSKGYRSSFSKLDSARASLYLKSIDLKDLNETIAHVTEVCAASNCFAAGEAVVYADYSNRVVRTLLESFISSLLLVGALIVFLAYALSASGKLELLFSIFWGPVLIVGALALFRVPMNLTNSMFASVLVGLTGDNMVQYLFASKKGNLIAGIHKRRGASVHVTTIAALSSFLFVGLTLVPLKILGLLLSLGFLISLAGDLWVLNGLIEPRN